MNSAPMRRWLNKTPRFLAAYHVCVNQRRRRSTRDSCLLLGLMVLTAIIMLAPLWLLEFHQAPVLITMHRHRLFLAGLAALFAAVLISRRRASLNEAAKRSWLAALPTPKAIARWERVVIETAPSLGLIGMLMTASTIAWVFIGANAGIAPIDVAAIGFEIAVGIAAGTLLCYCVPMQETARLPPGSRYVPHRSVKRSMPVASLASLGWWPVRHLFANARPKTVARAAIPILLTMPMGTSADVGMLVIAIGAAGGALILLVIAVHAVSGASRRWLLPLPLPAARLVRRVLGRPLAVILVFTWLIAWLLWLMGASLRQSAVAGLALMIAGVFFAVAASVAAVHRSARSPR
jgi:hypothetical protein